MLKIFILSVVFCAIAKITHGETVAPHYTLFLNGKLVIMFPRQASTGAGDLAFEVCADANLSS